MLIRRGRIGNLSKRNGLKQLKPKTSQLQSLRREESNFLGTVKGKSSR